jgi:hypothetical protein
MFISFEINNSHERDVSTFDLIYPKLKHIKLTQVNNERNLLSVNNNCDNLYDNFSLYSYQVSKFWFRPRQIDTNLVSTIQLNLYDISLPNEQEAHLCL